MRDAGAVRVRELTQRRAGSGRMLTIISSVRKPPWEASYLVHVPVALTRRLQRPSMSVEVWSFLASKTGRGPRDMPPQYLYSAARRIASRIGRPI